eukprot:Skav211726  [mRNA]  locus=scaffold1965:53957:57321:- [translate_table: standard]
MTQFWRLRDKDGKPPGLIGWLPSLGEALGGAGRGWVKTPWRMTNLWGNDEQVLIGYAYILTHPGSLSADRIPSVFWDHIMDWGDEPRKKIGSLMKARRDSGTAEWMFQDHCHGKVRKFFFLDRIPVDAPVHIHCADDTLYLAEIGSPPGLRVALGPRPAGQPDMRLGNGAAGHSSGVPALARQEGGSHGAGSGDADGRNADALNQLKLAERTESGG